MSGHPGSFAMPHVLWAPHRGQTSVKLLVSLGDDLCYITMAWEDYLGSTDDLIVNECLNRGWLQGSDFAASAVEEVGVV